MYRMVCVGRVYGMNLALTVPVRVIFGNCINSAASFCAVQRFFTAKWKRQPLVWVKTEHAYPNQAALAPQTQRIGELLVANGYITSAQLDIALSSKPAPMRLGEHLVRAATSTRIRCTKDSACKSASHNVELNRWSKRAIARSLPAKVAARNKLVPFSLDLGRLFIAVPELPTRRVREELGRFTSLKSNFTWLRRAITRSWLTNCCRFEEVDRLDGKDCAIANPTVTILPFFARSSKPSPGIGSPCTSRVRRCLFVVYRNRTEQVISACAISPRMLSASCVPVRRVVGDAAHERVRIPVA